MSGFYKAQAETDHSVTPQIIGDDNYLEAQTIAQDATRAVDLVDMTVMAQIASSRKWTPLRDVDPAATPGSLLCGVQGTNIAGWQAVTNGSFKIGFDGEDPIHLTGLDFSSCTILATLFETIEAALAGRGHCTYDPKTAKFGFSSATMGVNSAVSYLTAGTSGTDISGAGFLNGLTGTGVITAGTGLDGSHVPRGIYRGGTIAAATIVAGDTTGEIHIGGYCQVNETDLVLENSLTLNTVIPDTKETIRAALHRCGFYPRTVTAADAQI